MILIVNLNPAIDKIYEINNFELDKIHRVYNYTTQAGGKGINVARASLVLKGNAIVTGILGGFTGKFIIDNLNKSNINNDFEEIRSESRTCLIFIDPKNKTQTVVNEDGPAFTNNEITKFLNKFNDLVSNANYLVISGSIPNTLTRDIYNDLVEIARNHNVKCIVDTSKTALNKIITAKPYILKNNIYELCELNNDFSTIDKVKNGDLTALIKICQGLITEGIENIIISLGELGALYLNKDSCYFIHAPKIISVNAVGSGDAMTAGIVTDLDNNKSMEDAIISGVAAGSANATVGGLAFTFNIFKEIRSKTQLEKLF